MDLGIMPTHLSFGLYAGLIFHFLLNGQMYPKDGVKSIVVSLLKSIRARNNNQVLMKATVKRILVSEN
jgi:phytoene dehydrogenase-like protein